jgi:hypothetical protein
VCLSGHPKYVYDAREAILNETPLSLVGYFLSRLPVLYLAINGLWLINLFTENSAARKSMWTGTWLPISPKGC